MRHRIAGGALGQALGTLETGGLGSGIDVPLDDKRIANIGWETVTVHGVATGQKMFQFSIGTRHVVLSSIAYSPDGKRIITDEEMGYAGEGRNGQGHAFRTQPV